MKVNDILKNKLFYLIIPIVLCIVISVVFISSKKTDYKKNLVFTKIEKKDIKKIISSTGTLKAKGTVEIGTQVSGTILKVYVNYNDNVKKNQLLALLDTTLLEIAVNQCEADYMKSKSQYELNIKDYNNKEDLYKNKLISEYEFETSKVSKDTSYAQMLSSGANLQKAKANLQYAYIRSPIDGTVIDKDVEEGQTVAASLSSPTFFIIAENLSKMEIHALVDESDISSIKIGQKTDFTVSAYNNKIFTGAVREIRLNPSVVSNVVNYTVVADADNKEKILLPGMTATIDFIINEKKDTYAVLNSALRFIPTNEMLADLKKKDDVKNKKDLSDMNDKNKPDDFFKNNKEENDMKLLWYINSNNNLDFIPVKIGISDDQYTEIIIIPEDKININVISGSKSSKTNNNNTSNSNKNIRQGPPMF